MSLAYTITKHAITGLTESLNLVGRPFDIACGQIKYRNARNEPLEDTIAANPGNPPPTMDVSHVGLAVFQMVELPPEVNVLFMNLMTTKLPCFGRS